MLGQGAEIAGSLGEVVWDIVQDAVLDTLYLVPFLLITYLLMEWIEHRTGDRAQDAIRKAGGAGPAIGALLGAVPQCGFSAAASTLYAGRVITLGTLFSVYLSTSDEMVPIFIAEQVPLAALASVLGAKIIIGMAAGFAVDAMMRIRHSVRQGPQIHDLCERDKCHCDHDHDTGAASIAKSAIRHTLQVTIFILIVSLALNAVLAFVGEEALGEALGAHDALAVIGAGIVGLIPNCAASVAIAQLYIDGMLGSGAMMAGLLSAAGVGLLVLLRSNRPARQNALVVLVLLAISVVCGLVIDAAGISF